MWDMLIPAALSMVTGAMNNNSASARQEDAQGFSAAQFASRYQTTTADMKAAGLNPMLAYSQGGGSSPTSSAASSAGTPDLGQSYNASRLASAQVANVEADTQNKRAQSGLIEAQIGSTNASADASRGSIGLMEHQSKKIIEELKNVPKEGNRLDALASQLDEARRLMLQQGLTAKQVENQTKWLAVKAMHDSDLAGLDVEAAKSMGNIGRDAGQLKPVFDIIRGILSMSRK